MKSKIHPKYSTSTITCACGNKVIVGSTQQDLKVELCSKCHPFYTGKQRIVDTENLVRKFEDKKAKAKASKTRSKSEKAAARRAKQATFAKKEEKTLTLRDMIKQIKK